ncbi:uncharacterized protein RJT20DRAFT_1678 [Scheffersomyces xylosifermentans]|uniref:uncharacterized protein n=1 Tax=Scheffersomyces xylosifermentans TaxID=1304137 RepID=UPI00315D458F
MIPLPTSDNQLLREHAFYETGNSKYVMPFIKNYIFASNNNLSPNPGFKLFPFLDSNKNEFFILAVAVIAALLLQVFIYAIHKIINYRHAQEAETKQNMV